MYLMIRNEQGTTSVGLVLAVGRTLMRVAFPQRGDIEELSSSYGQWFDEAGRSVEIECLASDEGEGVWQGWLTTTQTATN